MIFRHLSKNPKILSENYGTSKTWPQMFRFRLNYKELYDKTLIRDNKIKELGYNLVTIWENDWKKNNSSIKILQQKFKKYHY